MGENVFFVFHGQVDFLCTSHPADARLGCQMRQGHGDRHGRINRRSRRRLLTEAKENLVDR